MDTEEDAQTVALQEYFDSNTPAGYGASFRAGWDAGRAWERREQIEPTRAVYEQGVSVVQAENARLKRLLDRAYPWLHNPYTPSQDALLCAQFDAIKREIQVVIAHLPEQDEPPVTLPCASCDGDGCPNCEPPMVLSE